jgi:RNA polymerase sigma-70 factor, ECF subfamily
MPHDADILLDADRALRHLDRLFRYALAITGGRDAAEDLVQDTFETLLRRPRRLRAHDNESAYLYTMLRNRHYDGLRAKRRRPQAELDETALAHEARTGESPHARAEQREVLDAIAQLSLPYRETLVAVDVAGLSYAETAASLDVPVGTVMSRLHRARASVVAAVAARDADPVLVAVGGM